MLDDEQIAGFRSRLLERQQELNDLRETADEAAETVRLDQTAVGRLSRMDALQGQAMSRERKRRRELELARIAAALRRIDDNVYGECLDCGGDIAPARLALDPSVSLCIQCANEADRRSRQQ